MIVVFYIVFCEDVSDVDVIIWMDDAILEIKDWLMVKLVDLWKYFVRYFYILI